MERSAPRAALAPPAPGAPQADWRDAGGRPERRGAPARRRWGKTRPLHYTTFFAFLAPHHQKIPEHPCTWGAPGAGRPRRAPGRLAGRGRTPREAGRAGAASLGQDAARWRARRGEAARAPRLGARAPAVVAQRRPRRTRSRWGLLPEGGRGEGCRPWRRARRGGGARRPLRAGRAVNCHQRQPGSLHRIRTQLFFRVRDHSGRRGAVGAKKCGN